MRALIIALSLATAFVGARLRGTEDSPVFQANFRTGAAVAPINQLRLDKLPSTATVAAASRIFLVDMPAEPGACLPAALLEQMVAAVVAGTDLVVFGGMFTLGTPETGRPTGRWYHRPMPADGARILLTAGK